MRMARRYVYIIPMFLVSMTMHLHTPPPFVGIFLMVLLLVLHLNVV